MKSDRQNLFCLAECQRILKDCVVERDARIFYIKYQLFKLLSFLCSQFEMFLYRILSPMG